MRISDLSSDVCSSVLLSRARLIGRGGDLVGALAGFGDDLRLTLPHFFDGHWYSPIKKAPKRGRSDWASAGASALLTACAFAQVDGNPHRHPFGGRSEEHTSELQSLMRISYAVFCLKKKTKKDYTQKTYNQQLENP